MLTVVPLVPVPVLVSGVILAVVVVVIIVVVVASFSLLLLLLLLLVVVVVVVVVVVAVVVLIVVFVVVANGPTMTWMEDTGPPSIPAPLSSAQSVEILESLRSVFVYRKSAH